MLELHHYPGNASLAPHILLREIGVPFTLVLVDRAVQAHKRPAYLALNPNGQIPVLRDGDLVLYEAAAICLHLADTHPGAALAPALGTRERAHFYKWLVWMTNTLQATLMHYFYPERLVDEGNADGAAQVRRLAQGRIGGLLDQLDAQFASHGQPWLLGEHHSAADAYAFMLCRWTRGFEGPASAPARLRPHLGPFLQRMLARPAVLQVLADEGLSAPWV
ncbi:glutathione S-transferase family protein [Ideonella sp. A 288]|uniref:glutathione S-transferase family protein n=1 Tax=Ideonella sp. A 288 TaxID=1962181 RepID=UPI000B4A6532|nr:glutathione S-transferase family protein [Ideonella sp. A 288]